MWFSPDGKSLWVSDEHIARSSAAKPRSAMWDLAKRKARFEKKGSFVPVAFSADSRTIALATTTTFPSNPSDLTLLDATTGATQKRIPLADANVGTVYQVGFSPVGDRLAVLGISTPQGARPSKMTTRIALYDVADEKWSWQVDWPTATGADHDERVTFSPDGRWVLVE